MILRNLFSAKQVGILYHYTSLLACRKIMANNFLKGFSVADPTELNIYESGVDLPKGIHGVVSFTRDKYFHRVTRALINTQVRFVVDGDKLSNNYKIMPYDYFEGSVSSVWDLPPVSRDSYRSDKDYMKAFLNDVDSADEMEEVALLRKGQEGITGFADYVSRVEMRSRSLGPLTLESFRAMVDHWWPGMEVGEYK